jgi:hypothetical protein
MYGQPARGRGFNGPLDFASEAKADCVSQLHGWGVKGQEPTGGTLDKQTQRVAAWAGLAHGRTSSTWRRG